MALLFATMHPNALLLIGFNGGLLTAWLWGVTIRFIDSGRR